MFEAYCGPLPNVFTATFTPSKLEPPAGLTLRKNTVLLSPFVSLKNMFVLILVA